MPEPIEELYVVIGSDISKLLKETKEGVDRVEEELKGMGNTADKETKKASKGIEKASLALAGMAAAAAAAAVAIGVKLAKAAGDFFVKFSKAAIAANSEFEVFTTQFETLLGSSGAAKKRLEELAQFGIETPFELNEIVEASRILQVFGGDVLATGDNLRTIGDIAAGVNQPFKDVATWVGRMYDAMQSGRPFGEAASRLQEMGALSGKARAELEKMQKEGASGAELWAKFNELVGSKFAGNMDKLSGTLQGITSNLVDFKDNLLRKGGEDLFAQVKGDAQEFLDIISKKEFSAAAENVSRAFGKLAAAITGIGTAPILSEFRDLDPEVLNNLAAALEDAGAALSELFGLEGEIGLEGLIESLTIAIDSVTILTNRLNDLGGNVVFQASIDYLPFVRDLKYLEDSTAPDTIRDLANASETASQKTKKTMNAYKEGLQALYESQRNATTGNDDLNDSLDETVMVSDAAAKAIDSYGSQLLDLQEDNAQQSIDLEMEHTQALTEIQDDYTDALADAEEKRTKAIADAEADRAEAVADAEKNRVDAIADLEKEVAKARKEAVENTRKELADLEEETNRTLKKEQDTFNRDELRETEDHLNALRQLRQQYLDTIDDAVKNRDARALVDAKKRFQQEQQEQESAFSTEQQRRREDQDLRLQEIREQEQRRAQEIMDAQAEELANLAEHESEKRAEIEKSYQEQLLKAEESYQEAAQKAQDNYDNESQKAQERRDEQLQKEQESYEKEKEQLEGQIDERLEQIAKGLADQEDITDEEAAKILETFAKYFGREGEIDKLMEDFANRRRAKLEIQVAFDAGGDLPTGPLPNDPNTPIPSFATGGTMIATRPTLAQFGEVPEMVQFTPLSKIGGGGNGPQRVEVDLKMSGSAPPGIRSGDRDQIAGVLLNALMEAGFDRASGGRGQ